MIVVSAALAVGALDSAQFATRNPKRARQSLSVAAVWTAAVVVSLFSAHGARVATVGLAAFLLLGGVALLVIHIRHGIATPRVWLPPAMALVALVFSVAAL
jgi:hypothetical protein